MLLFVPLVFTSNPQFYFFATAEERRASLEAQLKQALEGLGEVREQLQQTQEQLRQAYARIAELEKLKTPAPTFVKANKKKSQEDQKKARKKRDEKHNQARQRSTPTQVVEHRVVNCPQCHQRLGGITLARLREVIDIPVPPPVEVTHHRIYKGWCSGCQRWHEAPVEVQEHVRGQGRIGVRIASIIAYLRTVMRLPIRQLQTYLLNVHGFQVSVGEIVELLYRIAGKTEPLLDEIKTEIQASIAVQADETGWREDGRNGYIWSVCTPTLRYYEYHHTRAGEVVKGLIGEDFQGVLGSDFYGGYNIHQGLHQRCWVHFLRAVHDLKELHPHDETLLIWAKAVKSIYEQAVAWVEHGLDPGLSPGQQQQIRQGQQQSYEQQLLALCRPFVHTTTPEHTLCERVERFLPELFVFVAVPGVPAHNNLAERSVRPLVVARKISGGSRSPKGSQTRMALASIFGTWIALKLNPFRQCLAALSLKSSLGQV